MKKLQRILLLCLFAIFTALPVFAEDDVAKKMSEVLMKAPEDGGWQVMSDEVYMWIKTKKTDFVVIDTRPDRDEYKAGHIPGALHIPYNTVLNAENLKNIPKDKKIVLVCATGQLANLPAFGLRMLGYDAYTIAFGYVAWIKDYFGGEAMKSIVNKAAERNYPIEQTKEAK
ncbi:MAG: rhodanese-like domain-containing protein [Nitrospirae bacterium]|nr:rhodanese-like domain-containing protein [Nitrospirota bacterium]